MDHAFLVLLLGVVKEKSELVVRLGVVRIEFQRLSILLDRVVGIAGLEELVPSPHERVIIQKVLADLPDGRGLGIDELGDICGPVGTGKVLQQDGLEIGKVSFLPSFFTCYL